MLKVDDKIKARFCKDNGLQIGIFEEPYFTERLNLFNRFYPDKNILNNWKTFSIFLSSKYGSNQDYFEEYNRIKDDAINFIKSTEGFIRFNSIDMNQFRCKNTSFSGKDIFHPSNDRRMFLSIDMIKANFTSLSIFDPEIFKNAETWEDFIRNFTDMNHIVNSKYIRQVILGNCNPKRHVTYEKYLMDQVLTAMVEIFDPSKIVSFSNDEIVFDITEEYIDTDKMEAINIILQMSARVITNERKKDICRWNIFKLFKLGNVGYAEKHFYDKRIVLKCVNQFMLPFVLRTLVGDAFYEESDYIFMHESKILSRFIETPEIEIPMEVIVK